MEIKHIVSDILFPRVCAGCGREGKYICDECSIFVSETEMIYNLGCLDGLTSIWEYEGLVKELIHTIKYHGVTDIIKELISQVDLDIYYPYITYVPMHIKKKKKRGFNQSELIAEEIGKASNSKVVPLLKKIIDTEDQVKLNKEERLKNIKNCFKCVKPSLMQKEILLVDDVFTAGVAMQECCRVLKQAGVEKVWGFTLARTL